MTVFAGIQLGSPMVENSALPLDRKTLWVDSTERNNLTVTQRRLWMIWYKQDDELRYKMINEPGTPSTTDGDWEIFGTINSLIIDITYADLQTEIWNATLIPGMKYRITDYQTIHLFPGTTDVNIWPIEELIVIALSNNTISENAKSDKNPFDDIRYDWTKNVVTPTPLNASRWWPAGPSVGDFSMVVTGANIFTIDRDLALYPTWTFTLKDPGGDSKQYTEATSPGDYDFTDLWGWIRQFTAYTFIGDLLDTSPEPGNIQAKLQPAGTPRPGWIFRRKDTIQNIDCPCDFREVKQYRYLLDTSVYPVWDIGTAYAYHDLVYNVADDVLYVSNIDNNIGNDPMGSVQWGVVIIGCSIFPWLVDDGRCGSWNFELMKLPWTQVPYYMFNSGGGFGMAWIQNFKIGALNIDYPEDEIPNFVIMRSSTVTNFSCKDAHNITFNKITSNNIVVDTNFYDNICYGDMNNSNLGTQFFKNIVYFIDAFVADTQTYTNIFSNVSHIHTGSAFYRNNLNNVAYHTFGTTVNNNVLHNIQFGHTVEEMSNNKLLGSSTWCIFWPSFWWGLGWNIQMPTKQFIECVFWPRVWYAGENTWNGNMERCIWEWNSYWNTYNDNQYATTFKMNNYNNTYQVGGLLQHSETGYNFIGNTISAMMQWIIFGKNNTVNVYPIAMENVKFGNNINNQDFSSISRWATAYDKDVKWSSDFMTLFLTYLDAGGNQVVADALV